MIKKNLSSKNCSLRKGEEETELHLPLYQNAPLQYMCTAAFFRSTITDFVMVANGIVQSVDLQVKFRIHTL